jgi:hypothetical protein
VKAKGHEKIKERGGGKERERGRERGVGGG